MLSRFSEAFPLWPEVLPSVTALSLVSTDAQNILIRRETESTSRVASIEVALDHDVPP